MKISSVDVWTVVVPAHPGSVDSDEWGGTPDWPSVPKQIVHLRTDDGATGVGETRRGLATEAVRRSAEQLLGRDVAAISLQNIFRPGPMTLPSPASEGRDLSPGPYPTGYEAFEMAVFDLTGKRLGVPVHALLGGAVRDRLRVHYWIGQQTPRDSASSVQRAMQLGFSGIKIKCQLSEPNVERLRAMWEVGGSDFKVTIDPNERFDTVEATLALAEKLGELGNVEMFEDPIPRGELDDETLGKYRQMREALPFPLALTPVDLASTVRAVAAGAADYLNLPGRHASMVEFVKAAAIAEAGQVPVWHGSGVDLGIMERSYLHAASVAPNCALANDTVGSWVREDDLVTEPLTFENGQVSVPQAPGLGCELDMDAIEKYRVDP